MPTLNYAPRWFYQHIAQAQVAPGPAVCALCGLPGDPAALTPKARVFRPTFVDYDLQARAELPGLCPACVWYFDHQELLRTHWYLAPSRATPLAKAELLPLLTTHLHTPPAEDRYYLITFTKKKHVALRARINAAGSRVLRVNAETYTVDVDDRTLRLVTDLTALRTYHAWQEIESDNYLPYALLRWPDLAEFEQRRAAVQAWLRSPQYQLARYLYTPPDHTDEREENEQPELPI